VRERHMITLYRVFLVLMAVVAGCMMPEAMGLPRDSQYTIGPGFLPMIMLGLTIACCVVLLLFDLREDEILVALEAVGGVYAY